MLFHSSRAPQSQQGSHTTAASPDKKHKHINCHCTSMNKRTTLYCNQAVKTRATLTLEEKQKIISRTTDKGQHLNKHIQRVSKYFSYTIFKLLQQGKHMRIHKKGCFCALSATESIRYLVIFVFLFDFHAKPQLCISPKALGRFCKTKLHVFHACMVCHPPSDVHMECLYTGRAAEFEQCKPILTTSVYCLQPKWLKLHRFGALLF